MVNGADNGQQTVVHLARKSTPQATNRAEALRELLPERDLPTAGGVERNARQYDPR
jgi:hypothetical protein